MGTEYFQSKSLTRDYHSLCGGRFHILDMMVARRSWRRYQEGTIDAELLCQLKEFVARSGSIRGCPDKDIVVVADKARLRPLFKGAYKGIAGKINPWLPKSGAAGLVALAICKEARHQERPTAYAFPSLVGQDVVLWLTERGLGSVWLAGLNGKEMARGLGLPSDKWVPAMIVFGRTGKRPGGLNLDNVLYQSISRKRKSLQDIIHKDYYGQSFDIPEEVTQPAKVNLSLTFSESLELLAQDRWHRKGKRQTLTPLHWELLSEAARISPSATNRQPWKFLLIQEEKILGDLKELLEEDRPLSGAIACLGMSMEDNLLDKGLERPFWMIDLPIAISSVTMMAGALELSARVYIDIPEPKVNSLLRVVSPWRTVGLVGLR